MKLTINKLIANDIINYAMDNAETENYIVSLNTYLNDFEDNDKKYILDNIDSIIEDIENNENVLDLEIEKNKKDISFDMIFYWGKLLNQVENIVYDNSRLLNIELDYNDVKNIAEAILDDDEFNDDLINRLKQFDNGKEI